MDTSRNIDYRESIITEIVKNKFKGCEVTCSDSTVCFEDTPYFDGSLRYDITNPNTNETIKLFVDIKTLHNTNHSVDIIYRVDAYIANVSSVPGFTIQGIPIHDIIKEINNYVGEAICYGRDVEHGVLYTTTIDDIDKFSSILDKMLLVFTKYKAFIYIAQTTELDQAIPSIFSDIKKSLQDPFNY